MVVTMSKQNSKNTQWEISQKGRVLWNFEDFHTFMVALRDVSLTFISNKVASRVSGSCLSWYN